MQQPMGNPVASCRRHTACTQPAGHVHPHQLGKAAALRRSYDAPTLSAQHSKTACGNSRHSSSPSRSSRQSTCLHALASSSVPSSMSSSGSSISQDLLQELLPGTLLQAQVDQQSNTGSSNAAGTHVYLEVLTPWDAASQSFTAASDGRRLRLSLQETAGNQVFLVTHLGPILLPNSSLVSAFPGWSGGLAKLQAQLAQAPAYSLLLVLSCQAVSSLQQLEQHVLQDPSPWCAGAAPGQGPPTGVDYQVQSAAELLCLLSGARGLVMMQLYVGWDATATQPVFNPYVITLLQRVVANKDLAITMSSIQNGLGVTALVSARKDPWKAWAKHMASFGAQAALVAGSPFYQLLIGRMLGYKEEYIQSHIMANSSPGSGRLTPQVVAAVDAEMARISAKKPTLPWNSSGSRGKKKGQPK